jgi:hypothetical protein
MATCRASLRIGRIEARRTGPATHVVQHHVTIERLDYRDRGGCCDRPGRLRGGMAPDSMPNSTTEVPLLAVAVTCGSLAFGYLLASTILESLVDDRWLLWALALPGLIVFSVVLTVVHALSGGELYSRPIAVWILTAATVVVLVIVRHRKRRSRPGPTRADLVAVLTGVVAIAVWSLPALDVIPLVVGRGDHLHHMAWTNQLLNGEPLPTGALTGTLPNDYPWRFHGLTALLNNHPISRCLGPMDTGSQIAPCSSSMEPEASR